MSRAVLSFARPSDSGRGAPINDCYEAHCTTAGGGRQQSRMNSRPTGHGLNVKSLLGVTKRKRPALLRAACDVAPRSALEPGTRGLTDYCGIARLRILRSDSVSQFPQIAACFCPESADRRAFCGTKSQPVSVPGRARPKSLSDRCRTGLGQCHLSRRTRSRRSRAATLPLPGDRFRPVAVWRTLEEKTFAGLA